MQTERGALRVSFERTSWAFQWCPVCNYSRSEAHDIDRAAPAGSPFPCHRWARSALGPPAASHPLPVGVWTPLAVCAHLRAARGGRFTWPLLLLLSPAVQDQKGLQEPRLQQGEGTQHL